MDVRFLLFIFGALTLSKLANHYYYHVYNGDEDATFDRSKFPDNFVFGTASSAYQYEGAYKEDGKGPSIWDTFTHQHPEKMAGGVNGDVADDQYHRYKEDVQLMKDLGLDAYRFSISWARVLPNGKLSGGVNRLGIQYYNNLIDELLSKGLKPFVTLFHWDVPQHLDDEYGGFLSSRIAEDFQDYVDLCFKEFGDRVKHWITINEPRTFCNDAYNLGKYAPGRCSPHIGNCSAGNSSTEPYLVGHNILLAHAAAVKVYKEKYQADQKGEIGITIEFRWILPLSEAKVDMDACQRGRDFFFGWFMDPLTKGDYPETMKTMVGNRLPKFSKQESEMVKGSFDFLGLNYYTSCYAENIPASFFPASYLTDSHVNLVAQRNGIPLGPTAASPWLVAYPPGFRNILVYVKKMYGNPAIYVTENGYDDFSNITLSESLEDKPRVEYYSAHLKFLLKAVKEGVDVRGYFAWSLLDNIEWAEGYTVRFGINYVDYKTLQRYPKASALWFKKFLLQ